MLGWSVQVALYCTFTCFGGCHLVLYSILQMDLKARRHMLTQDVWAQTTAAVLATLQAPFTRTPVSTFPGCVCSVLDGSCFYLLTMLEDAGLLQKHAAVCGAVLIAYLHGWGCLCQCQHAWRVLSFLAGAPELLTCACMMFAMWP